MLVMNIDHFITKAISAINFPALLSKVDVQWSKLHVDVWASWNVSGSNHKPQVYMVWWKTEPCSGMQNSLWWASIRWTRLRGGHPKYLSFEWSSSRKWQPCKTDTCVWATLFQDNQPCQVNRTVGVIRNTFILQLACCKCSPLFFVN